MSTRTSIFALALAFGLTGAGAAIAEEGQRQIDEKQTLMEERAGTIGVPEEQQEGDEARAPEPARQGDDLAGAGAEEANKATRATSGSQATSGSLQYGETDDKDAPLPAKRQGTIGTEERPPEPVEQGGGGSRQ